MGYEMQLFRPKRGAMRRGSDYTMYEDVAALESLDQAGIGDFLLQLGPGVRFATNTVFGEQYVYEDEQGCAIEIIVSDRQIALGFPSGDAQALAERSRRIVNAIALTLVARFDLILYDPQSGRYVRASRQRAG